MKRLKNGIESNPLNAESFGRYWTGPEMKNLLIPKDEANKLMIKVRRGIAEFKSSMLALDAPSSYFGKNPSVANNIANDMCTYERTICLNHFGNCNNIWI